MYDPIKLEVFKSLFSSVAEEMGETLGRTGFSPNIKERRDYSCAIFDGQGWMVAQGDHLPVHLGSMPLSVLKAIEVVDIEPGDVVILNDPFQGGTHLPDLTVISGVFKPEVARPRFYVANRAHHADVGGMTPGSMPLSRDIFQEGIRVPPLKLVKRGQVQKWMLDLILANVRTPEEREGDIAAQLAANRTGERRLLEILGKYGVEETKRYMKGLQDYAERMTRKVIRDISDGEYRFQDFMDDDGISDGPVRICVRIVIEGDTAMIDFTGSSAQVQGSVNATYAVTLSAVFYVFRSMVEFDIPSNYGCMVPLKVVTPKGSVVNAEFPAAVAGGNVETSQRIVDVLLGALSKACPQRIPAASCGSMNNVAIGGVDPKTGKSFAYYETIAGGTGARPNAHGIDGVHTHMTNTMNTPVEAIEHFYPLRVRRYCIRRGSGGRGRFRGGDGIRRDLKMLCDAHLSILSDRRKFHPYGLKGGEPGQVGENVLISNGEEKRLGSKADLVAKAGDMISIRTPGGGGYGRPKCDNARDKRFQDDQ